MCRTSYYRGFLIFNRPCSDIWKKYFYQQKIYTIKIIFLTLRVGGIFSSGSLPSEALSSHVLASSGCWGSCQFLLVPKHQFVPCTLSLLPQQSFWQHLHCDLASAAVLETWARSISIRGSLRNHLLWELVSPLCQVLHLWLLCCEWQRERLLKNLYDHQRAFVCCAGRLSSLSLGTSFSQSTF